MLYYIVSYVSCSGSITSVGGERASLSGIVCCNYVVSVRRGFLFLLALGMGCVILLWHSLCLPYLSREIFYLADQFCCYDIDSTIHFIGHQYFTTSPEY